MAEYHAPGCECPTCVHFEPVSLDTSRYQDIILEIAKDLHSGKLKPSDLNQSLISQTYADLSEAAGKGYKKDWGKFPADGKGMTPIYLKRNIYAFSGAKTYAQLEAINKLLYDKDGKLLPFNEFSVLAKKHNRQYNENHLQAEYQTARTAAQMTEKWERLQETKDLFPNLKYRTVGDSRVRPDHERLNGVIKPIDDRFWDRYYPPLDWRCRCDVVATAEDPTDGDQQNLPEPILKGNVGKSKEIFTKKGTYFRLAAGNENAVRNLELSKLNAPYQTAFKAKKAVVKISIFADENDKDENFETAKIIADRLQTDVLIRPHLDADKAPGQKNGEYLINGYISDLKSQFKTGNYNAIQHAFAAAKKQRLDSIVFDFTNSFPDLNIEIVNRKVLGKMNAQRGTRFKEIIFVYKGKAVRVTREQILNNELLKELKKLKADS